jgi:hypothetical protein
MLKKCVVILVLCTLIAGAAFAEVTLGGQLQEGMTIFSGNNVIDDPVNMGGTYSSTFHEAKISLLFGDGTAGGRLVMNAAGGFWGWLQWRPNQYFRVKVGRDGDGEGGFAQIIGWGFTGEAKNSVSAVSDYNGRLNMKYRNAGLGYGGFDGASDFNLGFWIYPIDDLAVTVLFREFDKAAEISERFAKAQLFASYKLEEVGTIRFAWEGKGGLMKDAKDGSDIGNIWLAFHSSELVEGLGFELGARINLPHLNQDDTFENINIAAGFNLTSTDPFNLKLRTNIAFGGKDNGKDRTAGWGIGLLPSYKLPKFTVFLHTGIGLEFPDGQDTVYDWFINPYIWMPVGNMRMWVGVQINDAHNNRDGMFTWNVPFGFNFYF